MAAFRLRVFAAQAQRSGLRSEAPGSTRPVAAIDAEAEPTVTSGDGMGATMLSKALPLIVAAFAAVGLLCGPATTWAFCIGWDKSVPNYDPHYYSVSHEFRRSKYVVEVRVLGETWLDEEGNPKALEPPFQNGAKKPWGFDPYLGAYYDVGVLKSFKGDAPATLRLFSENSTARFWFEVGSKHVLFVSEGTFDHPIGRSLTMDTCGNSRPASKAAGLLEKLRQLGSVSLR